MTREKLEVTFRNSREIRMGSPFNVANLELKGKWMPELPNESWQDMTATSPDGRFVALVAWAISADNKPGYRIYTIDLEQQNFSISDRVSGLCEKVEWDEQAGRFECNRFLYVRQKGNK